MYFEIYRNGKLKTRGKRILNTLSWSHELMMTPSVNVTLPVEYLDYISGREDFIIHVNGKVFWGIVKDIDVDKSKETIDLTVDHVICEWENRQISVNNAIKNKKLNVVYEGANTTRNTLDGEVITASPFSVLLSTVSKLNDAKLIKLAKATAWSTNGTGLIDITKVTSAIQAAVGSYDVTFATAKGTSVTIQVRVKKKEDTTSDPTSQVSDPEIVDSLENIYADANFAYPGWTIDWQDDAGDTTIDYVYSKQNKLEALTKSIELTDDLWWRVGFDGTKTVEVGKFGHKKPYSLSLKPTGSTNIRIIEEPRIDYDFSEVINVATVYSQKSDSGMSSLTLREVYQRPGLQLDGFPVVILRENVNNERDYSKYITQYPKLAPNNELEYAVLDEESIALEGGAIVEGSFAFNDLSAFNTDSQKVTDNDRIRAAKTAYQAAVRKLKQARRTYSIEVQTEELPPDVNVGDKVILRYDNSIWHLEECTNYWKKVLAYDDWFYITKIDYDIDETGVETDTVTLCKYLKIDRETNG